MSSPLIEVRVFTHPTCTTCPNAIRMVQRLVEQDPQVRMELVSLATAKGRETAKALNVLSVPTIFVNGTRFVGVPAWNELFAAVNREKAALSSEHPSLASNR
jgi:glutaredoxin